MPNLFVKLQEASSEASTEASTWIFTEVSLASKHRKSKSKYLSVTASVTVRKYQTQKKSTGQVEKHWNPNILKSFLLAYAAKLARRLGSEMVICTQSKT